ncbi:3-hydroxyacyl-CoA dehydrogenase [Amylibacter marinus]|uniref:3-hydroxyacyl-CoA dehydrogenase n=1 Tax=Amylibacter marinus TaxID=1475483 RepID=A0ABQ5VUZ1_9RHOB|nr:3-hydroxyacyl-CoA dehydrogenase/enoyl-CoA hydratase family protein [Amylibacter marinus]GLQ34979.1 3-hydroxyacyl-CoA dehydrogenase [Amylibacter marinus]
MQSFSKIAVIGAGTMGSGIAAQIANAGQEVLLLDLAGKDSPNAVTEGAKQRLLKSDPPALVHKSRIDLITAGNIEDDFHRLGDCDWIVEAVVERLEVKRDLYRRLNDVIRDDCVVTSNTSTIPISLLVAEMPKEFRARFAITHYFNPVRYMRLLELVRGADTDAAVMDRLADFNDRVMGKGVVQCNDTPGFLGNRVGVFALQVGMDEAANLGLRPEVADALMGRPMGIPKTGVFGLYDLIGVDLMADVVNTLGDILPSGDAFHGVGVDQNPVMGLIKDMVADGYSGNKGKGGFYRDGGLNSVDLATGTPRPCLTDLPPKAQAAADAQLIGKDTLPMMISGAADADTQFCRRFLARVLGYAASLIPDVTHSPQDIDDAMKLGFNWVRGPFEMIDALGAEVVAELIREAGIEVPDAIASSVKNGPFYTPKGDQLAVLLPRDGVYAPVTLPAGTTRFHITKQCLTPIFTNEAASLYIYGDDLRLIEFHSKANALTGASMQVVAEAARNHGRGIIVHNDAQHFSAGVDLNQFRIFIEAQDWTAMDGFLNDFQQAVRALKYAPVPVICAPSGLTIGGGCEVMLHCDQVLAHTNTVFGLVEAGVGVVPGGGGVKETLRRWHLATGDWEQAAWNTWMQIGYAKIANSPEQAARLQYYLPKRDGEMSNRDKLLDQAVLLIEQLQADYTVPEEPKFILPSAGLLQKMSDFMDKGIQDGLFFPHDKTTAMQVAEIVVNSGGDDVLEVSEQEMFDRERKAFLNLAQTPQTHARIASLLDNGSAIRN